MEKQETMHHVEISGDNQDQLGIHKEIHASGQAANAREHETTVRQALRGYPWAVFWSLVISMSVIMEGYDTILIGSLYGYPEFQKSFGHYSASAKSYQVAGKWQAAMGSGPQAGAIVGALINGWLTPKFGYRPMFIAGLILMIAFVFVSFFGMSVELQAVGQILCGVPWGIFATIGPAYASELCPLAIRPYLTAYTNMCFAMGQLIGAGVLKSLINRPDNWSWRIPFAIQWIWPPFLIVAAIFMPESPWYLVRKGRPEEAERMVKRLMAPHERQNAKSVVAMMTHTNEIEMKLETGTSYLDCFRGIDLRRTEIACVAFLGQITCGAQFAYSATYFFEQAGINTNIAYALNLGDTGLAFCGTLGSWFLMRYAGRRVLYISGMSAMFVCLMIIGFLTLAKSNDAVWGQAAMCLLWLLSFSLTIGPVGWAIPPEVSSTRLRSKTVVLARNTYYVTQIVANIIEPYFINPTELNWKGLTGFFWAGCAFCSIVWAFLRLPETKNRTYEELDVMFAAKLPTKKFKQYVVDAYDEDQAVDMRAHAA